MWRRLASALVTLLACAGPAAAATAPGRVALPFSREPESTVDAGGALSALATPDGGAVMVGRDGFDGIVLTRLRADGRRHAGFGNASVTRIAVRNQVVSSLPHQLLARPGGGWLVVVTTDPATKYEQPRLTVVALTAAGSVDRSYGTDGFAATGIQGSYTCCRPAALEADGSLVLTGGIGGVDPSIERDANAPDHTRWAAVRLTPAGHMAPGGVREVVSEDGTFGYGAVVGPDGGIILLGQSLVQGRGGSSLQRVSPALAPEGARIALGLSGAAGMAVRADGSVDVVGIAASGTDDTVVRVRPSGELDRAFGRALPGERSAWSVGGVLETGDDALVWRTRLDGAPPLQLVRIAPDGGMRVGTPALGFGGGLASLGRTPSLSLAQSGAAMHTVVPRPGGFLALGGVRVVQYTGEGEGFSTANLAAAALTPQLTLDRSYGGPMARPYVAAAVPAQRARTVRNRRYVTVVLRAPRPGLAAVRVKAGGHVIAQTVAAIFRAGSSRKFVRLTRTGERALRQASRTRVTVETRYRDVVTATATGRTARGVLR